MLLFVEGCGVREREMCSGSLRSESGSIFTEPLVAAENTRVEGDDGWHGAVVGLPAPENATTRVVGITLLFHAMRFYGCLGGTQVSLRACALT